MAEKIKIRGLFQDVAKERYRGSTSSLDFKHKTEAALKSAGFGQARAKRIATGIRSGSLHLTGRESARVIKALKKDQMIKSTVGDVSGAVKRFAGSLDQGPDQEDLRAKRMAMLSRLRQPEVDRARQWLEDKEQARAQAQPARPAMPVEKPEEAPTDLPLAD